MRLSLRRRSRGRNRRSTSELPKNEYFSYHSSRLNNETAVRRSAIGKTGKGKSHLLRDIPTMLAVIAIIISVGYSLTLSTNPKIISLSARSDTNLLRSEAVYWQAARQILENSLADRTKITIDSNGFEAAMKQKFPELDNVAITLPLLGRRPVVQLAARTPGLVLITGQGDFVIDTTGLAMIKAPEAHGLDSLGLASVADDSNVAIKLGKGVLTHQDVTFIQVLVAQLKAAKQPLESLSLPPLVNEFRIKLKNQPYYVKFDMQNDPRTSAGAFLAAKQKFEADNNIPSQYVDARLEDRVFLK